MRPRQRYIPHSYWLLALSLVLTLGIAVQLVYRGQVFAAGVFTFAMLGTVVAVVLYVPRHKL